MLCRVQRLLLGRSRGGIMNTTRTGSDAARVPNTTPTGAAMRGRTRRAAGLVVAVISLAFLAAAPASAEDLQEVSWFHPNPDQVRGFILFVSSQDGSRESARQIDVGKPAGETTENGQFFSAMVEMTVEEYVAVSAIGRNGLESGLSAWARPEPSRPGQPLVVEP